MTRDEIVEVMARAMANCEGEYEAQSRHRVYAIAALSAIEAAGLVVVPREPTPAMCKAGFDAQDKWPNEHCDNQREREWSYSEPRWKAMLAAGEKP